MLLLLLASVAMAQEFSSSLTNLNGVTYQNCKFILYESATRGVKLFWFERFVGFAARLTSLTVQDAKRRHVASERASARTRRSRLHGCKRHVARLPWRFWRRLTVFVSLASVRPTAGQARRQ